MSNILITTLQINIKYVSPESAFYWTDTLNICTLNRCTGSLEAVMYFNFVLSVESMWTILVLFQYVWKLMYDKLWDF